jgi:hypothetical protein
MEIKKVTTEQHPANAGETCEALIVEPLPEMPPYVFAMALRQSSALKGTLVGEPTVLQPSCRVSLLLTDISAAKQALEEAGQLRAFAAILPNRP